MLLLLSGMVLFGRSRAAEAAIAFGRINHLIVIYMENWSFDGLFGRFPEANGIAFAGPRAVQTTKEGVPYATLPQADSRIPAGLPNGPFNLEPFVPLTDTTKSPEGGFYEAQFQINGGKMDRFVAWSGGKGLTMSYYIANRHPLGLLAQRYTLCDNFFQSAFGQSALNHFWLIAANTPDFPDAPDLLVAKFDAEGHLLNGRDYAVTPDFRAVGDLDPVTPPFNPAKPAEWRVPLQTSATIGDRLTERGVPWAWYAENWDVAEAGDVKNFVPHHQPFTYYAQFAPGTPGRAHLQDLNDFLRGLQVGQLPAVSFIKPGKPHDMHPGRLLLAGEQWAADLVAKVQRSPVWRDSAIVITFDENGGRWDHVPPPQIDRWGPGPRVPAIIISPFGRKGFVDHTAYETLSILRFIETRWGLRPLNMRDARAPNIVRPFMN